MFLTTIFFGNWLIFGKGKKIQTKIIQKLGIEGKGIIKTFNLFLIGWREPAPPPTNLAITFHVIADNILFQG